MPSCGRSSNTFQLSSPKTRTGDESSGKRKRALFVGEQPDQDGLAGAVRPEDRRVLARADFQRQSVKDRRITFLDAGIG